MPTFIMTGTWTDQGIRAVKEAPKRAQAARDLAKKLDVEIKQVFLTSGESDLLLIVETPKRRQHPQVCDGARLSGEFAHPYGTRLVRSRNDQIYFRTSLVLGAHAATEPDAR
jgi:GYD domain